jgi:PEP-CTERM motif
MPRSRRSIAALLGRSAIVAIPTIVFTSFAFGDSFTQLPNSSPAVSFYQDDVQNYNDDGTPNGAADPVGSGVMGVDPSQLPSGAEYINVVDSQNNWVVQNLPVDSSMGETNANLDLDTGDGNTDGSISESVFYSPAPLGSAPSGTAASYTPTQVTITPQGMLPDPTFTTAGGPGGAGAADVVGRQFTFVTGGSAFSIKLQTHQNLQAALNQCGPSAAANGLTFLAAGNANFQPVANNSGQGVFNNFPPSSGSFPYAGNGTTQVLSNVNTRAQTPGANTLVGQLDLAMLRQSGTYNGGTGVETPNRNAGGGPTYNNQLQGIANYLSNYSTTHGNSIQSTIKYERMSTFNLFSAYQNVPKVTATAVNGGIVDTTTPGFIASELASGNMVNLCYQVYQESYQKNKTTGNFVAGTQQFTSLNAHAVDITGCVQVLGTYWVRMSSDYDQQDDTTTAFSAIPGSDGSFWTPFVTYGGGNPLLYLFPPELGNTTLKPFNANNNLFSQDFAYVTDVISVAVPEPASLGLLALAGVAMVRRRR